MSRSKGSAAAIPGSRAKQPLELDDECGLAPTLRLIPTCENHTVHIPCERCGDCTGGIGKGLVCKACKIFEDMGWEST